MVAASGPDVPAVKSGKCRQQEVWTPSPCFAAGRTVGAFRETHQPKLRRLLGCEKPFTMKKTAAIPFAGSQLGETRHVCAFFNSNDEAYRVLLPFIKDGFHSGHKAIHVINPEQHEDHLTRLAATGIDTSAARQGGQLELRSNTEAYLRDGRFDPDQMLELFENLASKDAGGAFPLSRIVCQMDWAVEGRSCVEGLVEFESRVNEVWQRHEDVVICVYDLAKFGGSTVIDILRTHPMVIIGGILQHNPFFVPPEEFLRELRERRTGRTGA